MALVYLCVLGTVSASSSISFSDGLSEFDVSSFLSTNLLRTSLGSQSFIPLVGDTHEPCTVKKNPRVGVCMHSWECVTAGGVPLGTCSQGFLYGSCCFKPTLVSALTQIEVGDGGVLKPTSYGSHSCGIRSKIFSRRGHVLNGENAQFGEFPWQMSLRRVTVRPYTVPWCGGALLNHEWILTAAHCFNKVWPTNIIARAGELNFKNPNPNFPYVERRIVENIPHPKYQNSKKGINDYDIGLLRMEKPIRFQPHIAPICLPGETDLMVGDEGIVAGWGKTEERKSSSILKKFRAPILNTTECVTMFSTEGYTLKISNTIFCAGFSKGELDACQGDSGGPLQMIGQDGRFYVSGIVSTGIGCGKPNFPGLYIRVSPFLHWILETMAKSAPHTT